jgi:hypothetical protein
VVALLALVVLGVLSLRVPPFVAAVFAAALLVGVAISDARGRALRSA